MGRKKNPHKRHMAQCTFCKTVDKEKKTLMEEAYIRGDKSVKDIADETGIPERLIYRHLEYFKLVEAKKAGITKDVLLKILGKPIDFSQIKVTDQIKAGELLERLEGRMPSANSPKTDPNTPSVTNNTLTILSGVETTKLQQMFDALSKFKTPEKKLEK
jgi:hypothetical protein